MQSAYMNESFKHEHYNMQASVCVVSLTNSLCQSKYESRKQSFISMNIKSSTENDCQENGRPEH